MSPFFLMLRHRCRCHYAHGEHELMRPAVPVNCKRPPQLYSFYSSFSVFRYDGNYLACHHEFVWHELKIRCGFDESLPVFMPWREVRIHCKIARGADNFFIISIGSSYSDGSDQPADRPCKQLDSLSPGS